MTKISFGNEIIEIACENEACGNCEFIPDSQNMKCKKFGVLIDHLSNNSGWMRCSECIKAEVKL